MFIQLPRKEMIQMKVALRTHRPLSKAAPHSSFGNNFPLELTKSRRKKISSFDVDRMGQGNRILVE